MPPACSLSPRQGSGVHRALTEWAYAHGSQRRQVAGDRRHQAEERRRGCERKWIGRAHVDQHPTDDARGRQSDNASNQQPRERQSKALFQHHPDSDLLGALAYGVAHHAVQADGGQKQADRADRKDLGSATDNTSGRITATDLRPIGLGSPDQRSRSAQNWHCGQTAPSR